MRKMTNSAGFTGAMPTSTTSLPWSIESGGRDALLDEIYVSRRDVGIGSAAVEAILADCRARRLPRIFLETETANDGARRLFLRHGFVIEESIWLSREL